MQYSPTTPAERCTAHHGAHALYEGACYAFGRQVPRPTSWRARPVTCRECGADMDVVRHEGGRTMFLTAGTDERHWHPDPPRIELDEDRLASAIVAASRASRQVRQYEESQQRAAVAAPSRPSRPLPPADPPPDRPAPEPRDDIPTVAVWSPERDDGSRS